MSPVDQRPRPSARYLVPRAGDFGGIQRFARDSARAVAEGWDVDVVDLGGARSEQARRLLWEVPRGIGRRDGRPPVVHHWHVLSAVFPRVPVDVVTCHGNEVLDPRYRRVVPRALRRAGLVTTPSEFTRELVLDRHGADPGRVRVVHPSVEANPWARTDAATRSEVRVGTLTRLVPRKNVGMVVRAVRLLADRGTDVSFHLAGGGPMLEETLRACRDARISFRYWGEITEEVKARDFLPGLDVFALPSLHLDHDVEGFGIVYLEANAAGVPVVGSVHGGSRDAIDVGRSGLLADPTDVEDVADCIARSSASAGAWRASALAWAESFSAPRLGQRLGAVYRDARDADGPGGAR